MLAYERLDFDSDQAIVGLMAKHLSELRTFPLFFYGQDYMLGVQAWIAAPFFWLGGPTVAMLRAPLLLIELSCRRLAGAASSRVSTGCRRGSRWRPCCLRRRGTGVSANLLETLGASVEPFLYVLLLWTLRGRPAAFGVVLAVGFLHREFTIFAVAGIGLATYRETGRSQLANFHWVTRAALGFVAVWIAVDQLKRRINTMGPPGGAEATGPLILQLQTLLSRVVISPSMVFPKLRQAVTEVLPDLLGMRTVQPLRYNINAAVNVGTMVVGFLLVAAGAICLIRLAAYVLSRRGNKPASATWPSPFCTYMAVIGVQALLAYSLSDAVDHRFPAILRYALLAVFLPIALVTAFFEVETRRTWRAVVAVLLAVSAVLNTRDSWRIIDEDPAHADAKRAPDPGRRPGRPAR